MIEHILLLDVLKQGCQQHLVGFKAGETCTRKLSITLTCGGKALNLCEGTHAELYLIRPDGLKCHSACETDTRKNKISHIMTTGELSVPGRLECEIRIQFPEDKNGVIPVMYSPCFDILVEDTLYSENAVVSDNENSEWSETLQRISNAESKLDDHETALSGKASKAELDLKADKSELDLKADKSEVETLLETKADKSDVEAALADKADKSELLDKVSVITLNWYDGDYTEEQKNEEISKLGKIASERNKSGNINKLAVYVKYGENEYLVTYSSVQGNGCDVFFAVADEAEGFHIQYRPGLGNELFYLNNVSKQTLINQFNRLPNSKIIESWADDKFATHDELGGVLLRPVIKTSEMTAPVGADEDGRLWYDPIASGDVSVIADKVDAMEKVLAELTHEHINITKFTLSRATAELGASVQVLVEVRVDKVPDDIQLLRGTEIVPFYLTGTVGQTTVQGITATTTFKLIVTDDMGHEITQSKTISFYNGVYTGAGGENADIGNLSKTLQGSRGMTFTVTAGEGEYIYYACPTSYGTPTFKVGGFEGGFDLVETADFTNASGYTEQYQLWRSTNANLGKITVAVS